MFQIFLKLMVNRTFGHNLNGPNQEEMLLFAILDGCQDNFDLHWGKLSTKLNQFVSSAELFIVCEISYAKSPWSLYDFVYRIKGENLVCWIQFA